jgi:signal transduction histidine kinase
MRVRVPLILKFILSLSAVIIVTSVIFAWYFVDTHVTRIRRELENRCTSLTRNLALNSEYGVLTNNRIFLLKLTEDMTKEDDVIYSIIYDKNGSVLSSAVAFWKHGVAQQIDPTFKKMRLEGRKLKFHEPTTYTFASAQGSPIYDVVYPITIQYMTGGKEEIAFLDESGQAAREELIGIARVGISLTRMNQEISTLRKGIVYITLGIILLGILLATLMVRIIVTPLRKLAVGTQRIASGDLTYRVAIASNDEIGNLAHSFNCMANDLKNHAEELSREREGLLSVKAILEQRTGELEATVAKIQKIQQELLRSEKFATIGRLSASVAHELRNPLASVKNISYYLLKTVAPSDEKAKHMLEVLSTDVIRANKIVTDLMDYSRIRRPHRVPVKIDDFINKLLDKLLLIDTINVIRQLESVEALIDPDRIAQVLINLITNARDAMQRGGTITIAAWSADAALHISVADTGTGMNAETAAHIFEPLFTTKVKGLGLGLAIVKEIIDSHLGQISVTSEPGKGTTFHIILPHS